MNADLQHRLFLALETIPSASLRQAYAATLVRENPREVSEIRRVASCFERTQNASACFSSGNSYSENERSLYQTAVRLGEQAVAEHWNEDRYLTEVANPILRQSIYRQDLHLSERAAVNSIITFFAGHLAPSAALEGARTYLRSDPAWADRIQDYQLALGTRIQTLHPARSPNSREWERHDVVVPGFRYAIPVFLARGAMAPWPYYKRAVLSLFESLKVFLTPRDLERLVHSPRRDMAFYFADTNFESWRNIFNRTGIPSAHPEGGDSPGRYDPSRNYVADAIPIPDFSAESIVSFFLSEFAHTFFHELAHAFHHCLLDHIRDPGVIGLYRQSEYLMNSHGYIPDLIPDVSWHPDYSRRNIEEFFAQWVGEHFRAKLSHQEPPSNTPQAWRLDRMDAFFARHGINPQAFLANLREPVENDSLHFSPRHSFALRGGFLAHGKEFGLAGQLEFRRDSFSLHREGWGYGVGLASQYFPDTAETGAQVFASLGYAPIDFINLRAYASGGLSFGRYGDVHPLLGAGASVEIYPLMRMMGPRSVLSGVYLYGGGPTLYSILDNTFNVEGGVGWRLDLRRFR